MKRFSDILQNPGFTPDMNVKVNLTRKASMQTKNDQKCTLTVQDLRYKILFLAKSMGPLSNEEGKV